MGLESRIRSELRRAAEAIHPEVETRLDSAIRTERRRGVARRAAGALVAMALVVAAVAGGRALLGAPAKPRPAHSPTAPADTAIPAELAGTYTRSISAGTTRDLPALAGTFILHLGIDGVLRLEAPRSFHAAFADAEGIRFTIQGNVLVSGAFFDHCGQALRYQWTRDGSTLQFTTTGPEPCRFRRTLFTGGPWSVIEE